MTANLTHEADNIYIDISFTNINEDKLIQLNYDVTKTQPFLKNAKDYYLSVASFDIPLQSLPLAIMPILANQPSPRNNNISTLKIGVQQGSAEFFRNIIYVSNNTFTGGESVQDQEQMVITPYYFIYAYEHMLNMVNKALALAHNDASVSGPAPYFIYENEKIKLVVSKEYDADPGPEIIMNFDLAQYIDGFVLDRVKADKFVFKIHGYVTESQGYTRFGNNEIAKTNYPNPPTQPDYYKIEQEFFLAGAWNPVRRILILTNTLPIRNEVVPISGPNSVNKTNEGVYSSLPVLASFVPQVTKPGDSRRIVYFSSEGNYGARLIDILADGYLNKIDLKLFFQDYNNNIYPLVIPDFTIAALKLQFINKKLYKRL